MQTSAEQFEKTKTRIYDSPEEGAKAVAAMIAGLIRQKAEAGENAVLGLATGATPVPVYRELIRLHKEEDLSFANVITYNLDEYCGLGPDHRESYFRFMQEQLFEHIDIPEKQVNVPDGLVTGDAVYTSCREYEESIARDGGIDIQILGIGRTGHIGFNEPGSTRDSRTRMLTLDRLTRRDAAADFLGEENVPRFAITMGVGTILEARRIILMAWGERKASIVAEAVEKPVTDAVSASFLQEHDDALFVIDRAASGELTRVKCPWLVGEVDWNQARMRRKSVSWLAARLDKPVLKLVDEEYSENGMADLLTKEGPAYKLNILIFNQLQHTITGWPGGKPNADDAHRPERASPHPKTILVLSPEPEDDIIAMGGTLDRLVEQGHDVHVCYLTSGNLRVPDAEVSKFASILLEAAEAREGGWAEQEEYAQSLLKLLEEKGEFGMETDELRAVKSLIRRGDAREALEVCGVRADRVHFMDLPFYEKGRYRQFVAENEDVKALEKLLNEHRPHRIFTTGSSADPSTVAATGFRALTQAFKNLGDLNWTHDCNLWIYTTGDKDLEPNEIDMAVPMSPDQLANKVNAVLRFQTQVLTSESAYDGEKNRATARLYDQLGLPEYEAIEVFQKGSFE